MLGSALIVGTGALGSVYGWALARSGLDVQLLARRESVRAIRSAGGVRVLHGQDSELTPVRAESEPDRIEPADLVLVLTKAPDTEVALESVGHVKDSLRLAVSLQNGGVKNAVLRAWCGEGRVVGGTSMVGATLLAPGVVELTLRGPTVIGELEGGRSARVEQLAAALERGGLPARVHEDVQAVEWAKLIHAAPTLAAPALARLPLHVCLESEPLARLYVRLVREGVSIARAAGVAPDDDPIGYPLREIAESSEASAVRLVRQRGARLREGGLTEIRVSMLQSIERGRRTEVEAVHGFLVRTAKDLGVDAPTMEACYDLLAGVDEQLR